MKYHDQQSAADKRANPPTVVIFRTYKVGQRETIALFPEIPYDVRGNHCQSYLHIGQHGAACPNLSGITRPATAEEIAPLAAELRRVGYGNLVPRLKVTRKMDATRRANAGIS